MAQHPPPSEQERLLKEARETIQSRDRQITKLEAELLVAQQTELPTIEPSIQMVWRVYYTLPSWIGTAPSRDLRRHNWSLRI